MGNPVPQDDLPVSGAVPPEDMPGATAAPDQSGKLGPFASAAVRPIAKGVAAMPLMAMDAGVAARNLSERGVRKFMPGVASAIDKVTGGGPGPAYALPSDDFEQFLDRYTLAPKGVLNKLAEGVSSGLVGASAIPKSAEELAQLNNAMRQAAKSGYKVAPSEGGGGFAKQVQSVAGKGKVEKMVSAHNVEQHDSLARQALGLPEGTPLTIEALEAVRAEAGKAYEALGGMGQLPPDGDYIVAVSKVGQDLEEMEKAIPGMAKSSFDAVARLKHAAMNERALNASTAVKAIRQLRADASRNLKSSAKPAEWAEGVAQRQIADLMEARLERYAGTLGDPKLVQNFRNARRLIARSYAVEDALNWGTGHVNAARLARLSDDRPLDGPLLEIAQFAKRFPKSAQDASKVGGESGMTPVEFFIAAASALHNPEAAAAALARPAARSALVRGARAPGQTAALPVRKVIGAADAAESVSSQGANQ